MPGIAGVLLYGGGQLFHARRGLLQRGGLLLGTRGQLFVAAGDVLHRNRQRGNTVVHVDRDTAHTSAQGLLKAHQQADLADPAVTQADIEIARGQLRHVVGRCLETTQQHPSCAVGHDQQQHTEHGHHRFRHHLQAGATLEILGHPGHAVAGHHQHGNQLDHGEAKAHGGSLQA
ncbi:hypothetical protein D3C80_1024900 [compost metagenome]